MLIDNLYSLSYSLREAFTYLAKESFTDDLKVNRVLAFTSQDVSNSFNNHTLISSADIDYLFLDLFYKDKDKCNKNIAFRNLTKDSLVKFYVEDNLNFQISKIVAKKTLNKDVIISLLFDAKEKVQVLDYSNTYNVRIPALQAGTYAFSDFLTEQLSEIKVKKITTDIPSAYLTISADNQRVCNNIPSSLLFFNFKNEDVRFNDYCINIYESYLTLMADTNTIHNITFYY